MFNNRYLLILLAVMVVIICLCDNKKKEAFCDIKEVNNNMIANNKSVKPVRVLERVDGILDEAMKYASPVNILKNSGCGSKPTLELEQTDYSKMKSSEEPEFPDYPKL